mmetsp:Transcript_39922/g.66238  ORF Transcript_39922/g.66238 Transcript_39922/m.66238 type:complete len:97 (-) Transcript_39922:607-897(-)
MRCNLWQSLPIGPIGVFEAHSSWTLNKVQATQKVTEVHNPISSSGEMKRNVPLSSKLMATPNAAESKQMPKVIATGRAFGGRISMFIPSLGGKPRL